MPIEAIIYALFGLVIGSFLNVCIYRIPLGQNIAFPRSHCPKCNKPIRPYDNIPVLSYLLLGGKCRACKSPISPEYPFVELLTALAFYGCAAQWKFTPPTFVNSLFLAIAIVLIFIDYHHRLLPNILTIPGTAVGILLSPFQTPSFYMDAISVRVASLFGLATFERALPWAGSIVGAAFWAGILYFIGWAFEKIRKKQGLGMGDIKMIAMVGAFLGLRLAFVTLFAGSLLGTLVGIFLISFRNMTLQTKLAFGVFLGIGAALALFLGLPFLHWYTALYR
jgi:leader peptidase (prepilin peptidase) / N-methyltransferase